MKKAIFAILLAATAMPANAFDYIVYQAWGPGTLLQFPPPGTPGGPTATAKTIGVKFVLPLDPLPGSYGELAWEISGNMLSVEKHAGSLFEFADIYFDHVLTDFPTTSTGFIGGFAHHSAASPLSWFGPLTHLSVYKMSSFDSRLGQLTVSYAVPEPASWTLMIGGFALAGAMMRRRKMAAQFA